VEKLLVIVFLAVIVWNLFAALYHMVSKHESDGRMVRALSWRIGLSIGLLVLLSAGHWLGLWKFHGLGQ
jgi:hypothetical protein